jgi:hypothetical protein
MISVRILLRVMETVIKTRTVKETFVVARTTAIYPNRSLAAIYILRSVKTMTVAMTPTNEVPIAKVVIVSNKDLRHLQASHLSAS